MDNGANFTGVGQFKFALFGTGHDISAPATATASAPVGGLINTITVTAGGYGYTSAPVVTITGGGGSGATAIAHLNANAVLSITLNTRGSAYTSVPTVTIAPPPPDLVYPTLWSNDGTGNPGSQPFLAVPVGVTNGLFTVGVGDTTLSNMIVPIPAALFTQPNLLLGIWFSDGTNGFAALNPPQPLTAAPYAAYAANAGNATTAQTANSANAVSAANIVGTIPSAELPPGILTNGATGVSLTGTFAGNVTGAFTGGLFTGDGSGLTNVPVNFPTGLVASNFWQTTGNAGTSAGANFVGTTDGADLVFKSHSKEGLRLTTSQSFILQRPSQFPDFSERNGLGVYGYTTDIDTGYRLFANNQYVVGPVLYGEQGGGLGVISSTSSQTLALYWTSSGVTVNLPTTMLAATTIDANLAVSGAVTASTFANPGAAAGSFFVGPNTGNAAMTGQNNTAVGSGALLSNLAGTENTAVGGNALKNSGGTNNTATGYGALNGPLLGTSTGSGNTASGAFALTFDGTGFNNTAVGYQALDLNATGNGNVAVGASALYAHSSGDNNVAVGPGTLQNCQSDANDTAVGAFALQHFTSGGNNVALGQNAGNNLQSGNNNIYLGNAGNATESGIVRIGTPGTHTSTYIAGTIEDPVCNNITITGGSDLAEPFKITTADQSVAEGEVVVIDEANPGQLKLTDQPYDTHVAGVVSGANGIHAGIQMHQEGMLDGGKNVALSGRVYVQADTSNGAINPGDLLTTSGMPGRAMKVSDHLKAQGAILGKAMTSLKSGKGMVLVLVTLQ